MIKRFASDFWTQKDIQELSSVTKYIYIYLFTSCRNLVGVIPENINKISAETGISKEIVKEALKELEKKGKIKKLDQHIVIVNHLKYQSSSSPKILKKISNELKEFTNSIQSFLTKIIQKKMEPKGAPIPLELRHKHPNNVQSNPKVKEKPPKRRDFNDKVINVNKKVTVVNKKNLSNKSKLNVKDIKGLWNHIVYNYNSNMYYIRDIKKGTCRYKNVLKRLKEFPDLETWKKVFKNAATSDFLNGKVPGSKGYFLASFDWIVMSADNFLKVLEGNYNYNKNPYNRLGQKKLTWKDIVKQKLYDFNKLIEFLKQDLIVTSTIPKYLYYKLLKKMEKEDVVYNNVAVA